MDTDIEEASYAFMQGIALASGVLFMIQAYLVRKKTAAIIGKYQKIYDESMSERQS